MTGHGLQDYEHRGLLVMEIKTGGARNRTYVSNPLYFRAMGFVLSGVHEVFVFNES
jgi:hypothetical protein